MGDVAFFIRTMPQFVLPQRPWENSRNMGLKNLFIIDLLYYAFQYLILLLKLDFKEKLDALTPNYSR